MERQEQIILTGCQDDFPKEVLLRCREFLSTHTLDGDDPLEAWYQYIRWAEQHFPETGRTDNIRKLLHTCLNKFNSSEEYFQDVRFIKLWLKYADMADNPLQIYNQLSMSGIGVHCALFYKSWAEELFRNGDFKKADKVFREGLKKKAQPLNKLQSAYGNFHIAVARRLLDETKVHTSSGAEKWTDCIFGGRKLETSNEVSTGESQLITTNILKSVENLPSRYASKCPKAFEKAVNGKSTEKNETQKGIVERDTKQVSSVQNTGQYPPVHGTRLGNMHNDYKSKATDGFHCRVAVFEVPNPAQRAMYPKEKVYADNTEYSLEELRAASYVRKEENTDRGIHSHHVLETSNHKHPHETERSLIKSVVNNKLEEFPNSGHDKLCGTEENFSLCNPSSHGTQPTTYFSCRNVEKIERLHLAVSQQHSLTSDSTKLAVCNIPTAEILTAAPAINFKETSAAPDCGTTYSNQHLEKGHALSAEPDFSTAKGTVSSASTRNVTLRARNDSRADEKDKVHHIDSDGSGTAVHTSILLHKAEIISEPGHYTTDPKDLKENLEDDNALHSVSHHFKYEIPFVPSPGMTPEEIKMFQGTENKENEGGIPKSLDKYGMLPPPEPKIKDNLSQRTSLQAHATCCGVVNAMNVDKDIVELQPRQSALFSDSCISQMFAHTLLSSTPARKSLFHLANSNRMKSIGNPPVHSTNSEEKLLLNIGEEIQHEEEQLPHISSSETKELMNPVHDPPCMNKLHAISEIAEQEHNLQNRVLHQGHSYRDGINEINPFDDGLITQLLHHSGFVERNKGGWLKVLCKPTPRIRLPFTLKIDNDVYQVVKEIGKGSYARILCATNNDGERVALKVQKPSWLWEAYVEDQIQHRIKGKNLGLCFANPSKVYEYSDGSIMVHEYLKYGSILNFITEARKVNRAVNENVIFCFMYKIIEAIRNLHKCEIIHGDLKPDNIMIRSVYPPSIQLIDFGRAIDMTLFPPKTTFTYAVTTKDFQCTEMQAKKPWTYQTDIFGLLSTAHCFLFGEYMKVSLKRGKWVIQKSLPRSCHKQLWSQFFHDLLNIESCDKLPDLSYWEAAMQQEIDVSILNEQLKVIKNAMDGY